MCTYYVSDRGIQLGIEKRTWTGNSRVCLQPKATIETAQSQPPSFMFENPPFSFRERYKNVGATLYKLTLFALELGGRFSTIFLVVSAPDKSISPPSSFVSVQVVTSSRQMTSSGGHVTFSQWLSARGIESRQSRRDSDALVACRRLFQCRSAE